MHEFRINDAEFSNCPELLHVSFRRSRGGVRDRMVEKFGGCKTNSDKLTMKILSSITLQML